MMQTLQWEINLKLQGSINNILLLTAWLKPIRIPL